MIERKLLHFNSRDAFELLRTGEGIADTSIAFVKDDDGNFIYTHGEYYMGGQTDSDEPVVSNASITPTLLTGVKIADFVNGDNTTGSLYAPQSTSDGETSGQYYDQAFKLGAYDADSASLGLPGNDWPADADSVSGNNGWKHSAPNTSNGQAIWMITRLTSIDGTPLESWRGPWRISGPQGEAGTDGTDIEFIYNRNNTPTTAPSGYNSYTGSWYNESVDGRVSGTLTAESYKTADDFVPENWTDRAQGISEAMSCEWMCIRTKVDGEWGPFGAPILWAHWGHNGNDGDGVEYIYAPKQENQTPSDPYDWRNDADFNTAEYIRESARLEWFDDPQDLTSANYGPGSKQFVSVRKHQNGTWQPYSSPVVWSVYPKDGVASGYTVDLSNANMPVSLDSNGETTSAYTNSTIVFVAHNGVGQVATDATVPASGAYRVAVGVITRSDSATVSGISAQIDQTDFKTVNVSVASGINLLNVNVYIPVSIILDNGDVRNQTITLYGVRAGEDADFIDLYTSASAVKQNYAKTTVYPSSITVGLRYNTNLYEVGYSGMPTGYTFDYYYDADSSSAQSLSNSSITLDATRDAVTVRMYYNGALIDADTIPYVTEQRGIRGAEAVNYNVVVSESNLKVVNNVLSGSAKFQVTKQHDDNIDTLVSYNFNTNEAIWSTESNSVAGEELFSAQVAGNDVTPTTVSGETGVWRITVPSNTAFTSHSQAAVITLKSGTGKLLASVIIPISIKGDTGEAGSSTVQGLEGVVMRFNSQYSDSAEYYDGSVAVNGIKYMDIVLASDNNYYKPIASVQGYVTGVNPTTSGQTSWEMFKPQSDAYINTLISDHIAANDITAKQVVITQGSGQNTTTVAGMVSGTYVPEQGVSNNNGVRIFAGTIPQNGDLVNTAFNVDGTGNVSAGAGAIKLYANGSGQLNSNIHWDANGNITALSFSPMNGGSNFTGTDSLRNAIYITNIRLLDTTDSQAQDAGHTTVNMVGFIIKNGLFARKFNFIAKPLTSSLYDLNNPLMFSSGVNIDSLFIFLYNNDQSKSLGYALDFEWYLNFYCGDIFDENDTVYISTPLDVEKFVQRTYVVRTWQNNTQVDSSYHWKGYEYWSSIYSSVCRYGDLIEGNTTTNPSITISTNATLHDAVVEERAEGAYRVSQVEALENPGSMQ